MLTKSFRTRGAVFAHLVGPPRKLSRQEGMTILGQLCERLSSDDFSFKYTGASAAASDAFGIRMERVRDRETMVVSVDCPGGGAPVRILLEGSWFTSPTAMSQDFDVAAEAVFGVLGEGWQKVLAEARLRGQADSKGESAAAYLSKDILHLSDGELGSIGAPVSFLSVKFETDAAEFTDEEPLANPKREVTVEVLRDDPRCIYVEVMAQWPQSPALAVSPQGTIQIKPGSLRTFGAAPSEYLDATKNYVESVVLPVFQR